MYFIISGLCKSVQSSDKNRGPYFLSKELIYREKVGDSVTLACKVENLGKFYFTMSHWLAKLKIWVSFIFAKSHCLKTWIYRQSTVKSPDIKTL